MKSQSPSPSAVIPAPPNRLVDAESPIDCLHNVQGILALLSMIHLDDEAMPQGAQTGHFYLLWTVQDALSYVEHLLEQEQEAQP